MKLLYVTDLHGDVRKYDRLLALAKTLRADAVINGGDMLPKDDDLFKQGDFIAGYLSDHFAEFEKAGIPYVCLLGNDDLGIFDELFGRTCGRFPSVTNLAQRLVEINGYEFIGMNFVVDYPFRLKDRCRKDTDDYVVKRQFGTALLSTPGGWQEIKDWPSYITTLPTIEDELNRLPRPADASQSVYVIHMPPAKLDLDLTGGGEYVGSKAVYNFLKQRQPRLSLHGHIHEAPHLSGRWQAWLQKTACIQPGQTETGLTYVEIDLAKMEWKRNIDAGTYR